MKKLNTEAVKRCLINRTLLPKVPNWKQVYSQAREEHPECNQIKPVDPRELLEGEELPSSFTDLYHTESFPRVNFGISLDEQIAFEANFRDNNPLEDQYDAAAWETKLNDEMYKHFRALAKYENPGLRSRIGIVFENDTLEAYRKEMQQA